MKTMDGKKGELVEKLGIHFERKKQMAPMAARIFSYVILTGKQGTTFEDLVSNLCASKSTISTHLNHLQDLKKITYFTKTGDRKKYFIMDHDTMIRDIGNLIEEWKSEQQLHLEIMDFKRDANKSLSDENKFDLQFHESFVEFHDEAIKSINKLKETIVNN